MSIPTVVDGGSPAGWIAWLTAQGLAANTIRQRKGMVSDYVAHVPDWEHAGTQDIVDWMAGRPAWRPETRAAARASVRSLYRWARTTGRVPADPSLDLPRIRVPRTRRRGCPDAPLAAALAQAAPRERFMIGLCALMGLRRAEVAAIHSDDIDLAGQVLLVHGKGGRDRLVPVHPALAQPLAAVHGWAFPGRFGGHLSVNHVGVLISDALGPGWTAHALRRRAATGAYAASHDLVAVQELLGHASIATTQLYVGVEDDAVRQAVGALRLPTPLTVA